MIDPDKREFGAWWMWILFLVVLSVPVLFALNAMGLVGRTVVEREVFTRSYQREAGDTLKAKTFRAQLTEIERRLANPALSEYERSNLEAQAAAIRINISATGK